jgi:hypothetical protein
MNSSVLTAMPTPNALTAKGLVAYSPIIMAGQLTSLNTASQARMLTISAVVPGPVDRLCGPRLRGPPPQRAEDQAGAEDPHVGV